MSLARDITKLRQKNASDLKTIETEQVLCHYLHSEFMRSVNMIKDVDFADFKTMKMFYLFRLKDELDNVI